MAMHAYETCLISMSGKVSLFTSASYFSDSAAIRDARRLCKYGELIQVWRDGVCIHNEGISEIAPRRVFESANPPLRS
jgi:hypothetical protein